MYHEFSIIASLRKNHCDIITFLSMKIFSNTSLLLGTPLLLLLLLLVFVDVNSLLRFDRGLIAEGQWWRFISAHFVHLNGVHAVLNIGVLVLFLNSIGVGVTATRWCFALFFLCLFISLCLFWFSPGVHTYVGFSGVLHGMLVLVLLGGVLKRDFFQVGVLLLLLVKVVREQWPNFDVMHLHSWIGGAVIVDAHLYGVVGGAILFSLFLWKDWFFQKFYGG